jgi:hypothetical protein
MDNWEKTQRQKRFRNKSRHVKYDDGVQRLREPRRKTPRQRIDPNTWQDHDEFYEPPEEEFEEISDSD